MSLLRCCFLLLPSKIKVPFTLQPSCTRHLHFWPSQLDIQTNKLFLKNAIYFDETQQANFRGNPAFQVTIQHLNITNQVNQKQISIMHLIFLPLIVVTVQLHKKEITPKIRKLYFAIINSVLFKSVCVWILVQSAGSHFFLMFLVCFQFFFEIRFLCEIIIFL